MSTFTVELSKAIKLSEIEINTPLKVVYDNDRYELHYDNGYGKEIAILIVYEANCERYFHLIKLYDVSILLRLCEGFKDIKYEILK
jgi:hypothetical protein